jgi:NAD(P)-dependent dehydrogenase (short-subunit alcohol dehydrogenase family)
VRFEQGSAVVTGGASGLGRATARRLSAAGAAVVITDLPGSDGDAVARSLGDRVRFVASDITEEGSIVPALDAAESLAPLRFAVHCAGRGGDRLRVLDRSGKPNSLASFVDVVTVNLVGSYEVLRQVAARMAANEIDEGDRGAVVLTASVAAFDGQVGQTAYAASKGAVHAMTLVAARDLAAQAIRVNTIAPGTFDTQMLARFPDEIRDRLAAAVPHPARLGDPDDFADLAVSVLRNSYLNGETIRLDGAIRMPPR